jgi:site-specific recombinase XerD
VPEETSADKKKNAETMLLANAIKAQRIVELQNSTHGFSLCNTRSKINVVAYICDFAEKKQRNAGGGVRTTAMNYMALSTHIKAYSGSKSTFKNIDKTYCMGFIEYLRTVKNRNNGKHLSENTQSGYVKKFEAILNNAISDEVISINPFRLIKAENKPKKQRKDIIYLSLDEIQKLKNTECSNPSVKQAFLFSCFTGLRFSDVQGLTFGKIKKDINGGTFIDYVQRKTKKHALLPIPQKAEEFLPDRECVDYDVRVFDLPSNAYTNILLKAWGTSAGLKKHLTFHVARRSCATNLLTLGVRIEVVSEVLAHSDIKTTKDAYGFIENSLQREAMNKFDSITI